MKTTIYLATAEGLGVITESDGSWHGRICLAGVQLQCVALEPGSQGRVHCGSFGQGLFRSDDCGETWIQTQSLPNARVTALASPSPGVVFAGTEPSALYRSSDGGNTFEPLSSLVSLPSAPTWSFPPRPETHHVQAILVRGATLEQVFVAVEAGALLRSDDGGQSWHDRVPTGPYDTHTLVSNPTNQQLFSAAGDGCFESRDGGSTWQPLGEGLVHTYCWSVTISSSHPEVMLLSASTSAVTAHRQDRAQSFIYLRVGAGPWELAMNGLSVLSQARVPVIAPSQSRSGAFFLATDGDVFRSSDAGLSWEALDVHWSEG